MSDKKAAGQARKAAASDVKKSAEQGRQDQLEDADWEEGAKGKNKKAEAAEAKAAAAAERKALAKAQEDEENAQLSKPVGAKNKKAAAGASKMTRAEIAANAMAAMEAQAKTEKKAKKEIDASGGNEYIGAIRENVNKSEEVDASGLDSAIAALDVGAPGGSGGPKGRVNIKALYAAFEERELARLKIDQPGLKLSQYKERVFEAWKKSPDNPNNER